MKYIKYVLACVLAFVFVYLMTAFVTMHLDPGQWTEGARVVMCVFGVLAMIIGCSIVNANED